MEGDAGSGSAGLGPGRSSCLNALIVALNETCDGKSWYTSTKELQLASLEFCMACRNYQTVHLKVDVHIPRRLLAAADATPPHPKRLCRTRVPRLKARRVTWNMPTAGELRNPVFAMTDVEYLEFGGDFEGSLEAVAWPGRLKTIDFGPWSNFDKPIDLIEWPDSLQTLEFGGGLTSLWIASSFLHRCSSSYFGAIRFSTNRLLEPFCRLRYGCLGWGEASTIRSRRSCGRHPCRSSSSTSIRVSTILWKMSRGRRLCGSLLSDKSSISRSRGPSFRHRCCNFPLGGTSTSPLRAFCGQIRFRGSFSEIPSTSQLTTSVAVVIARAYLWVYRFVERWLSHVLDLQPAYRQECLACIAATTYARLQGLGTWMPNLETFRLLDGGPRDEQSILRGIE